MPRIPDRALSYGRQSISEADIAAVVDVLRSDYLTQGPKILEFEEKFADYVGARHAVAVANGTAALHLSVMALGIHPGDRVITTPITFAASANAVLYCGGEVDFVDIDPQTWLLDLDKLEEKLKQSKPGSYKAIIPVDFAGYPLNMERFRKIADAYDLSIIEDACHAPGGYFTDNQGQRQNCGNGKLANLAIFSFHPVKHVTTGEGGMITTDNIDLYRNLLQLRTHGITKDPESMLENHGGWYYEMQQLGYNYRLSDMQAALGISQLNVAADGVKRRNIIAQRYNEAFRNMNLNFVDVPSGLLHAYHLYIILCDQRKELYNYLAEHKIYTQVHYLPVHLSPYYQNLGWKKGDFPVAERYYDRCLSLPMYPTLTNDEQDYVIKKVQDFFG